MASLKQLREHLKEQQQPFVLDIYISERRVMLNKNTNRPCNRKLNKSKTMYTTKILKLILYKFICAAHGQQASSYHQTYKNRRISKTTEKPQLQTGQRKWFQAALLASSGCGREDTSHLAQISQALKHSNHKGQEVAADTNLQKEGKDKIRQLSQTSVVTQVPSSNRVRQSHFLRRQQQYGTSTSSTISTKNKATFSGFLWKLRRKSMIENQSPASFTKPKKTASPGFSQHLKKKPILLQSKQPLFGCVNEAMETETHGKKNINKYARGFMDLQELGIIISDKTYSQGNHLRRNFDISSIIEDWDYMQQLRRQVGIKIAEAIMGEIVLEVIYLLP